MRKLTVPEMKLMANRIRRDIIMMLAEAGSGHPGGSLSATEIMVALYFHEMKHDPKNPEWEERDRFVLSKGHICPVQYAVLARAGYYPVEEMRTLRKLGSRLQGHPGKNKGLPGIEVSSGSLGQGLSVAVGMAMSFKYLDKTPNRAYAVLGDGELQEGSIWEAFMAAGHYKLDNLVAIIDKNRLQIDGWVKDVMDVDPVDAKVSSFKWEPIWCDGHDVADVIAAFEKARQIKDKPVAIIAQTVKGKGVSFMEDEAGWHGKAPNKEQEKQALEELMKEFEELVAQYPEEHKRLVEEFDYNRDF